MRPRFPPKQSRFQLLESVVTPGVHSGLGNSRPAPEQSDIAHCGDISGLGENPGVCWSDGGAGGRTHGVILYVAAH